MAYSTIVEKVLGSSNTNERKILVDDVNQIRQVIQTGEKDLKTKNISLLGNTITADNGSNWIRRNNNTFQFYNGSSWQEPSTATLLTFTAGENIAARDVVYLKVSDGKIYKASTTNNDWIGVATSAITSGASGTIYPNGSLVGGFSGLTSGTWYGLNATAGTLTANENYIVGLAISATQIILVKPKGDMSTRDNALYKLQGEKAINDVSATNSGVLAGSSQVLIDKFLDSTGQNNTVDTGNTDAYYNSTDDYYECDTNVSSDYIDSTLQSIRIPLLDSSVSTVFTSVLLYEYLNTGDSITYDVVKDTFGGFEAINYSFASLNNADKKGLRFKANKDSSNLYFKSTAGTKWYLYDTSGTLLDSGNISGNPTTITYSFIKDTQYDLVIDDNGSSFTGYKGSIPFDKYYDLSIIKGWCGYSSSEDNNLVFNIYELSFSTSSQTSETGKDINEFSSFTNNNYRSVILKLNLNTADGSTTPKILGWRVLME